MGRRSHVFSYGINLKKWQVCFMCTVPINHNQPSSTSLLRVFRVLLPCFSNVDHFDFPRGIQCFGRGWHRGFLLEHLLPAEILFDFRGDFIISYLGFPRRYTQVDSWISEISSVIPDFLGDIMRYTQVDNLDVV